MSVLVAAGVSRVVFSGESGVSELRLRDLMAAVDAAAEASAGTSSAAA
jgi:hypothetical protein